jgi:UDP-hydrolysing UDP-N-acetyl-D-glucosamine 2-epimerase
MKKILAITSIRSDYDLLSPLYKILHADKDIDFRLLVSGAHLSKDYGLTVNEIKNDGFDILLEIETLIHSDSKKSKIKTASIFLQNSIDIVDQFNPDIILYAGDREDVIMGGLLGLYLQIPTIHFYGGDHECAGHEDTTVRHATSKLSTHHFVSHIEHQRRLEKLGENPERIFHIGSVALDKFQDFEKYSSDELSKLLNIQKINKEFVLIIYHPSPNPLDNDELTMRNILDSCKKQGYFSFVSNPNTDPNNNLITNAISDYMDDGDFYFYKNLPRDIFLSIFSQSAFIIGNSSAGLLEAASIPIPAINVGGRQKGRMTSDNVFFCGTDAADIIEAINITTSNDFTTKITTMKNLFGDGKSAQKAYSLIKSINFKLLLAKNEDPLCY